MKGTEDHLIVFKEGKGIVDPKHLHPLKKWVRIEPLVRDDFSDEESTCDGAEEAETLEEPDDFTFEVPKRKAKKASKSRSKPRMPRIPKKKVPRPPQILAPPISSPSPPLPVDELSLMFMRDFSSIEPRRFLQGP